MAIRRTGLQTLLKDQGASGEALEAVRALANKHEIPVREAAWRTDKVEPLVLAQALSELSGLHLEQTIDLEKIDPDLVYGFPLTLARERRLLPLYVVHGQLVVAIGDLRALTTLDDLRLLHGYLIHPILVPSDVLTEAINTTYDRASKSASAVLEDVDEPTESDSDLILEDTELLDDPNQAPIIRFVNALLAQAIKERASDIHVEPFEKDLIVRYRVDGVMRETLRPAYRFKNTIVARVKIMAGLNIAEKRLPQDGRIRRKMGGREIDLRVSTVPVRHGERVVMRILEKGTVFNLDKVGMPGHLVAQFRELIRRPHGILLVCGPTGSGKSTTLYSAISEINSPDKNILTIEDPVEYEVKGIGQVQVNPKINLTFANALRSFLRQDPDVILVGEIRDKETADNAVQASLTGHLVFSTIHTNDASGAFARLVEMGVEPFLVASSLLGVLAQRLVRQLCMDCKEHYVPSNEELEDFGLKRKDVTNEVCRAVGCSECGGSGYMSRTGIFEFLPAHDEIKNLILKNADAGLIKKTAVKLGMLTLRDDGIRKVLEGATSFDEVMRVTQDDTDEI